tara:strand:+ start:214 stop:432 length:219 start_codon:yes stop_codon:yes gene_type:complete
MKLGSELSDPEATRRVRCLNKEMKSLMDWHDSGVLEEDDRKLVIQAIQQITEELVQVMTVRRTEAIGGLALV